MTHRREVGGGGLTGATGHLTPASTDEAFEPGERREIEGPEQQADVTVRQAHAAPAQSGETGTPEDLPVDGPTTLAANDGGYGSEAGLDPNDPAYRMEQRARAERADEPRTDRGQHIGGDEVTDRDERF